MQLIDLSFVSRRKALCGEARQKGEDPVIPMIKKVFGSIIVIFLILLTVSGCYGTDKTMTIKIKDIRKHGNLILDTTFEEMKAGGIEVGDIITVYIDDRGYDLPVLCITENDGPYLIHCKEGKDHTGILCAILEYFAGAAADDVNRDYMTTYYNYYKVQPEDAAYSIILNNNFVKTLSNLFEVDDLEEADLQEEAEQYLRAIGLTSEQLTALGEKLKSE